MPVKAWLLTTVLALGTAAATAAEPAIVQAAQARDAARVRALIGEGVDVNAVGEDGTTALHWAVHNDDAALVDALLHAKANARATNDLGATPMSEAAVTGDVAVIAALLKAGADPDSTSAQGQTALMVLARTSNVAAARLLIRSGAKVNAAEKLRGQTALMWAAAESQPAMIRELLAHGADVNAATPVNESQRQVSGEPRAQYRPAGGFTALMFAARQGCLECAKLLVGKGARVDYTDPEGVTPLILAVNNFYFDTGAFLLDKGANPNLWDWWGRTALYCAVDLNTIPRGGRADLPSLDKVTSLEMIERLLKAGANPNLQLKLLPPYRAVGADRGADTMLSIGTTPLIRAAKAGDVESIRLLIKYKALPDLPNSLGITPIMAAAGIGSTTIDIRARFRNEGHCIEAGRLILAAGANVNATRDNGQTALHGAALGGWNDYVKFLAQSGARLDIKDRGGATALDIALGKAGVTGRVGVAQSEPHPETAALLRQLMAAR